MNTLASRFLATPSSGDVSALLMRPDDARALFVFGHGAGAGMRHGFMMAMCDALAAVGIATFRYQFPYIEHGRRMPDARPILLATVRAAVEAGAGIAPDLPVFAGGKSMGGRMTSLAMADAPIEGVRGIIFFGFPLHPAKRASAERGEHLAQVTAPMLFLQGTKDALADLTLLTPIVDGVRTRATLHCIDGADHGFHVPRASGRNDADVRAELARVSVSWIAGHLA
jgi:hypothetical protein